MVKFFKIIEKIVWVIAALAIVLVVIMMVYGIIANTQQGWQKVIPYLYLAAFLFCHLQGCGYHLYIFLQNTNYQETRVFGCH